MSNINQVSQNQGQEDVDVEHLYPASFSEPSNSGIDIPIYLKINTFACLDEAINEFDEWLLNQIDNEVSFCYKDREIFNTIPVRVCCSILWMIFLQNNGTPKYMLKLALRIKNGECNTVYNNLYIDFLSFLDPYDRPCDFLLTMFRDYHVDKITELYMQNVTVKPCKF